MLYRDNLVTTLGDQGISTEVVGDAIYRFSQLECEWMIPQHIIDQMLEHGSGEAIDFVSKKMFFLIRRIEDYGVKE